MKGTFLLIFIVTLLIYSGINIYILIRGWQALEAVGALRKIVISVAVLLPLLFISMFFVRRLFDNVLIDMCWAIGAGWVAAMLYFLMAVLAIDLLRLVLWAVGKSPAIHFGEHYQSIKFFLFLFVNIVVVVVLYIGRFNATVPQVNSVDITIEKEASGRESLSVVLLTDLHIGAINGHSALQRWITAVNKLSPDIVLIAGDIVDDSPKSMERRELGKLLAQINAPLGIYYAQGNHELYGDFPRTLRYLQSCGITALLDTTLLVDNSFYVVGRLDRSGGRGFVTNKKRKNLEELLDGLDHSKPFILLDHQPYELDKTVAVGVDVQLSGHTHGGQLWPFSLFVKRMYELAHGYMQKGSTHFYVSEGLGSWGPLIRIGTRSEIVQLNIRFLVKE
ncbi:MAG: metallophosphoesterase [Prevotellaceae bacterium]|jgi:predicted MPP superfamily phosphohydrolase|nr:metallophosphoesterase [Prevotellaceae bacterium]